MDRRAFLKTSGIVLGTLTAGGALAACGDGGGVPNLVQDASGAGAASNATWNVINASYELLTGEQQRFAFALTTTDNTPVEDAEVEVYTRDINGEVLGGPFPVESFGATAVGLPLYRARIDVPDPGPIEIVVVQGRDFGASAMNAVAPEDSVVPVPGQEAIAVATPTEDEPGDVEELCTSRPDCPMHDVSLDEALEEGRPVMLMFATPAYCQTAVCGPGVTTMQEVRDSRDWGDVAWIHAEIFTDEGVTVAEHVRAWELPSEPWLFSIGSDGRIVRRLDGPMIAQELEELATELT
jgi:hypothetical protein